jgi:hypothetical protein
MTARGPVPVLLLLSAAAASACASPPLPDAPPGDFRVTARVRGWPDPPCDFDLDLRAGGTIDYVVRFGGNPPGYRRGREAVAPEALGGVWEVVLGGGFFDLSDVVPAEGALVPGGFSIRVSGAGRRREVDSDAAPRPAVEALLAALRGLVPDRAWRRPGATAPPR